MNTLIAKKYVNLITNEFNSFITFTQSHINLGIKMLQPKYTLNTLIHTDAASEASTDSDDNYQPHPFLQKINPIIKPDFKDKIKSSLCRNFSEKGYCPYGYKCQFAHGIEELKCNTDENAYKTKPCTSYWKKGYCTYGLRCNFSHIE